MDNIQTLRTADTCTHATPARRLNQELWALRFTKKVAAHENGKTEGCRKDLGNLRW